MSSLLFSKCLARIFYWIIFSPTELSYYIYIYKNIHTHTKSVVVIIHLLSGVWLFPAPQTVAHQAPLSSSISPSLLKSMAIESVMLSNHLILCCPLLLLPSVFPSILNTCVYLGYFWTNVSMTYLSIMTLLNCSNLWFAFSSSTLASFHCSSFLEYMWNHTFILSDKLLYPSLL